MDDRSSPPRPPTRARRCFAKDRPPPPPLRPLEFCARDNTAPSLGSPPASSLELPSPPKSGTCSVSSHPDTDMPEETLGRVPESRRPRTARSGAFALVWSRCSSESDKEPGYGSMSKNRALERSVRIFRDLATKLQFFLSIGHQIALTWLRECPILGVLGARVSSREIAREARHKAGPKRRERLGGE